MPQKILIVDDDPLNLDLLEQELAEQDYLLARAANGEEALEQVKSFLPDLLLLDYMMPKMNGLEVIQRLKHDDRYKGIPIILLTGKGSQGDKVKGLDAGADDYVVKPFDAVELRARVRSMLRLKQMHDQLEEWNRTLTDRVKQQVDEIQRMSRLKRYLSPQIAELVLKGDDPNLLKGHRREITVVFLDLRGFTAFSDCAEPEDVLSLLGSYHAAMGELIFAFEGTLERFAGDGIMVFFNDPIPTENHTERAVRMALAMRAKATELCAGWRKRGYDLKLGVGLASGYATLGNIGFEGRMDYGAVGNVTNLASRLSDAAKGEQILTNQKTLSKIDDIVDAEPLEEMHLQGFLRPVAVFNVLGLKLPQ